MLPASTLARGEVRRDNMLHRRRDLFFSCIHGVLAVDPTQLGAIVSSVLYAKALTKRSAREVNGFIIEGQTAGGHNAPPRVAGQFNARGEPIYGEKDVVDFEKMKQLGRPCWLAGGYGHPEQLQQALAAGAAGAQVGTAFALCTESGMDVELKQVLLEQAATGTAGVFTNATASPTGVPL